MQTRWRFAAALVLAFSAPTVDAAPDVPAVPAEAVRLAPHEARTVLFTDKETHRYALVLSARQFVHVVIRQQGVDVVAVLKDPAGKVLIERDTPTSGWGREQVSWIATEPVTLTLEVRPFRPAPKRGYEITIAELRPATELDEVRLRAEADLAAGYALSEEEGADPQRRAGAFLERAVTGFHTVADPGEEAVAAYVLGRTRTALAEYAEAYLRYSEALEFWRTRDVNGEEVALRGRGFAAFKLQRMPEALADFARALEIARSLGDVPGQAEILDNTAQAYTALGEGPTALSHLAAALPLARESGDLLAQYRIVNDTALQLDLQGQKQEALELYAEALRLARAIKRRKQEAYVLMNVGRARGDLGDDDEAQRTLDEALTILRSLKDRWGEAMALTYVARLAAHEGRFEDAARVYRDALSLWAEVKDERNEAIVSNALAEALLTLGDVETAIRLARHARDTAESERNPRLHAAASTTLAIALARKGSKEEALGLLRAAAAIQVGLADAEGRARSLLEIARIDRAEGRLHDSRIGAQESIRLVESLRGEVVSPTLRATFLGRKEPYYEFLVGLLGELAGKEPGKGWEAAAFEAAESARARSLLDLLTESRVGLEVGVDGSLLARRDDLRRRLAGKVERQMRAGTTEEAAGVLAREIRDLRDELGEAETALRKASPAYGALTRPRPVTVAELQPLLDPDTLLLEFALGDEQSTVWAVGRDTFRAYPLPRRAVVEDQARRVYELLTVRNRMRNGSSPSPRDVSAADASLRREAATLSRLLLMPVAGALSRRRLVVVADGALHYVPFAALPAPSGAGFQATEHEIVTLPSSSTLPFLRESARSRPEPKKTLAVLADPVFDSEDPRVSRLSVAPAPVRKSGRTPPSLVRSAIDAGLTSPGDPSIPRLPFTRREAQAIVALVPPELRKIALDFDASRATLTSPDLATYRFVHLATHGLLDSLHPELSGLVLSLVDASGHEAPGFVSAAEVYGLKLPVELVVLSACQTALGREIRGEGLVGLTRAFLYAGAPRVVASLWKVDDAATAALMARFYAGMLGPKKLRPAAALHEAQMSVRREARWASPYYWAGFVLHGDWR